MIIKPHLNFLEIQEYKNPVLSMNLPYKFTMRFILYTRDKYKWGEMSI